MDEKKRQLFKTLKRLRETKRDEGICLMGWQARQLVEYIDELEERSGKNGTSEVQEGDRKAGHAGR